MARLLWVLLALGSLPLVPARAAGPVPEIPPVGGSDRYVIEPPDVLVLGFVNGRPRPSYVLTAPDVLFIQLAKAPEAPLNGPFPVSDEGTVHLGEKYGAIRVENLTVEQTTAAIRKALVKGAGLTDPTVSVSLVSSLAQRSIHGQRLVGCDGTVGLGVYGSVNVTGLTRREAEQAIERHLSEWLLDPKVSVRVAEYNSKLYHVILSRGKQGESLLRVPYRGETGLPPFYGPGGVRVGSTVPDGSSGRRSAAESARGAVAPYSAGVRYPSAL